MKKTLTLVLALGLLVGLCSFTPALVEEERVTLTLLQRLPASYVVEGNPVIEAWGERMGVNFQIEAPPISSFDERRNIIMASGELPDIIFLNNTGALYKQWAADGLLLGLDPYFNQETMPNATAVLTDNELFYTRISTMEDGLYSLPRVQTKPWDCIIYRQDWLENLSLEIPSTPAEFAEVMLAFATQDPDGNGKNDTYGWSLNVENSPNYRSLVSGFGLRPSEIPNADGVYELFEAQENYMLYMDWLRDMYLSGAMDPEFYTTKMYEDDDKFRAGMLGAIYSNKIIEQLITIGTNEEFLGANPEGKLVSGPAMIQEGQDVADIYYAPQVWGNYAVSADSEHIDKAVYVLDQGYTDAVNELLVFGLEGVTYDAFYPEQRYASKTDEQRYNAGLYVSSYATINYQRADKGLLVANGANQEEVDFFLSEHEKIGALSRRVPYLGGGTLPGYAEADLQLTDSGIKDEFKELRVKFICGQITREEFVSFLQDKYIPAYQVVLDVFEGAGINK